jgi:hypothetical protein
MAYENYWMLVANRRQLLAGTIITLTDLLGPTALLAKTKSNFSGNLPIYKEAIRYRSRTERNSRYYKKIDLLIEIGLERRTADKSYIAERLKRIDGAPNDSGDLLSSGLGFIAGAPGWIGKLGKTAQVLEFGSRVRGALASHADIMRNQDQENDKKIDYLFSLANQRPELVPIINGLLADSIGPIDGSKEEIIKAFPPFQDKKEFQSFTAFVKGQMAADAASREALNNIKILVDSLQKNDWQKNHEATMERIYQVNAFGNLAITLLRNSNPRLAQYISVSIDTYAEAATIMANMKNTRLSNLAACASWVTLSVAVFSKLERMGQPTPDEQISAQITELTKFVVSAVEQIVTTLGALSQQLSDVTNLVILTYKESLGLNINFVTLGRRIDDLEKRLFNANSVLLSTARASFIKDLKEISLTAVGYKAGLKPRAWLKTSAQFKKEALALRQYALEFSRNGEAVNIANRDTSLDNAFLEIGQFTPLANLPYIISALRDNFPGNLPILDFDPVTWLEAANTLSQLVMDWPEFASSLSDEFFVPIIKDGEKIVEVSKSLRFLRSKDLYKLCSYKASVFFSLYFEGLAHDISMELVNRLQRTNRVRPYVMTDDEVGKLKASSFVATACKSEIVAKLPLDATFAGGIGKQQLSVPPHLVAKHLPPNVVVAYALGIIDLEFSLFIQQLPGVGTHRRSQFIGTAVLLYQQIVDKPTRIRIFEAIKEDHSPDFIAMRFIGPYIPQKVAEHEIAMVLGQEIADLSGNLRDFDSAINPIIDREFSNCVNTAISKFDVSGTERVSEIYKGSMIPISGGVLMNRFESVMQLLFLATAIGEGQSLSTSSKLGGFFCGEADLDVISKKALFMSKLSYDEISSLAKSWQVTFDLVFEAESTKITDTEFISSFAEIELVVASLRRVDGALRKRKPIRSADALRRKAAQGSR